MAKGRWRPVIELQQRHVTAGEWTRIIEDFRDLSLLQTWEYGEARAACGPWRVERSLFVEGGRVVGAVQARVRPLPVVGGGLVWVARGPLWRRLDDDDTDPRRLGDMLRLASRQWLSRRFYVRVQPPTPDDQDVEGFRSTANPGWASALVDLTVSEADLRRGLHQKWRNVLNKAERSDLAVTIGSDDASFAAFLEAYGRFLGERGFATGVTPDLLRRLQDLLPEERKLTVCLARRAGEVVGSVLIARYGATAEYLAGTLADEGRRGGAGQLLLWRAMMTARAAGCRAFDLGGMDEVRTPAGIYRFKAEVGGAPYRLADEIEAFRGDPLSRLVRWRVGRALGAA
ncbi:MAG: GNAT family N-acetyltransferase [Alphaproteobacteria bacterium]